MTPDSRVDMRRGLRSAPVFTVGWHDAVFEHYRVTDEARLEAALPAGLSLDRYEGSAFVSVVSFRMVAMRWRGIRLPLAHTYPQINVRTYVRSAQRFGVFFLRNYVANPLAAWFGRALYGMPYVYQRVDAARRQGAPAYAANLGEALVHSVSGTLGSSFSNEDLAPHTLRYFLTERYPLFSVRNGATFESSMLHAPWRLQRLDKPRRTHACLGDIGVKGDPLDEVQVSAGVDTLMWRPYALGAQPPTVAREDVPDALRFNE